MSMSSDVFRRHWKIFLGVTAFVGLFSAIYDHYGRGVHSKPMIFAFQFPLVMGVLPAFLLSLVKALKKVEYASAVRVGVNLYVSGVATLTMGSLATGVVEIFGTTNRLLKYYWIVGWPLLAAGFLVTMFALAKGYNDTVEEKSAEEPEYDE
ncbi:MAG: hypothetical protein IKZ69_01750 [Lachnospiraceae bacterium]|nr:hypothetical protein [Lachnospiraceae bacterium]